MKKQTVRMRAGYAILISLILRVSIILCTFENPSLYEMLT